MSKELGCASPALSSPLYPRVGELWDCEGHLSIIAGNMPEEGRALWVMDWDTGERGNAPLSSLIERTDRFSIDRTTLLARFKEWAREGNSHAMWFLGWWYEVINHQRSVWYYVAALRAGPEEHKWAYSRIVADAHYSEPRALKENGITTHYPAANLKFLEQIPEMSEAKLYCSKWIEAVENAEAAPEVVPIPAPDRGSHLVRITDVRQG